MTTTIQKFVLISALCLSTFTLKSQSLLWIIEGNGLKKPSYMYGSMHTICKKDFRWDRKLNDVCDYTKQVYFELDADNIFEYFRYKKLTKVADENYDLKELYSDKDYNLIEKFFKDSLHVDIDKKANRSPLFLLTNYTGKPLKQICRNRYSYESEFARLFPAGRLLLENTGRIFGLETAIERDRIINQLSYERQAQILLEQVKSVYEGNTSNETTDYEELVKLYFEMDIEKLRKFVTQDTKYDDYHKVMLDDRNLLWVGKIPAIVSQKSTLFVVGAAHLGGEKGLVNLLKQQGFTVRPLSLNMKGF
jgi:uncharacterized protein